MNRLFTNEKFMRAKNGRPVRSDLEEVWPLVGRRAFTLVELLVVISIIALLMSILLAALGKAREAGRSVVCMANVRRISMAGYIYALENDGRFPPFRLAKTYPTDTVDYINKYGRIKPRWPWFFDHGIGPVIDPTPYVVNPGDTFGDSDTLIMTNDYFMCPSFFHSGFDKRDIRNGSYGYNYQYLGNSRIAGDKFLNFPVCLSKVRRQSSTIMIADSRGAGVPHGLHAYTLDPPKLARSVGAADFGYLSGITLENQHAPAEARHSGKVCVSFVDGHTDKMKLEEMGYVLDARGNVIADQGSNHLWSGTGRDEP